MNPSSDGDAPTTDLTARIGRLLSRFGDGDREALHELLPLVYDELRRLAHAQRRRHSRPSATLNTTALVHEVYLRLDRQGGPYANREHLFAVAATAMRQLLVDEARRHKAQKRGGGIVPVALDETLQVEDRRASRLAEQATLILRIDGALDELEESNARLRQVVECRFFGGLTQGETATALGLTERTVRRDWAKARAWLRLQLEGDSPPVAESAAGG